MGLHRSDLQAILAGVFIAGLIGIGLLVLTQGQQSPSDQPPAAVLPIYLTPDASVAVIPTPYPAPATDTLRPTLTPYPTHTPYPHQPAPTARPTLTPYPTHTPYPHQPTYTPYPTASPVPTPWLIAIPTRLPTRTPLPTATPLPPLPTATPLPLGERKDIRLPLTGKVSLRINRTERGDEMTLDILESVLRFIEGYMDSPIPLLDNVVRLDFAEPSAMLQGDRVVSGYNAGTYIAIHHEAERIDDDPIFEMLGRQVLTALIAHEVAHYYWRGEPWVAEGAAEMLEKLFMNARYGEPINNSGSQCGIPIANISELEAQELYLRQDCAYFFGRGLFLDLYRDMDPESFQQSFAYLYRLGYETGGIGLGIEEVRQSFPEQAAIVNRWYSGCSAGIDLPPEPGNCHYESDDKPH